MERERVPKWVLSDLSGLREGDWDGADSTLNNLLYWSDLEVHSSAIVGSAKVGWVLDVIHDRYLFPGFLSVLDSELRRVNTIQTSLNDWVRGRRLTLMYLMQSISTNSFPEDPSEASIPSYAVVVSALVLLSLVYQYLTGNVDRGGSKAYSRTSLDFRDVYVAIVLFQGAYVWIKFREANSNGFHPRTLVDKHGNTKVVYDARLTPPKWNGEKVPRLDLGRFATPQEAHNKFLIAAFYYNRAGGWLDGWFQVPPMSEEERRLTGLELRAWVIDQAKKVYKDFKKETEAALVQELLEACEGEATPGQDEVNVDACGASLLNSTGHPQPALASHVENPGVGMGMIGDRHGLECASRSFDGIHEGLALSNGHGLSFQEGSTLPVSQLPPNTESGMILNGSDRLDLFQTCVQTQQQQISLQQQQISDQQLQIHLQQQQIQELGAQNLQLQHQQRILQQQLQEFRVPNHLWPYPLCLPEQ